MLELDNVTLVAVASTKIKETIDALNYSSQSIKFNGKLLLTHKNFDNLGDIKLIKIDELKSIKEWSRFIIFDLHEFIQTEYILLIHYDGFVVNPQMWSDKFLKYDYIGSPWPKFTKIFPEIANKYPDNDYRVGNSVSIRSKKFLEIPSKIKLEWFNDSSISNYNEDGYVCVQKREEMEKFGLKYAPFEVACKFGREYTFAENKNIEPFVFHKWYAANRDFPKLNYNFSLKEKIKKLINFGYY